MVFEFDAELWVWEARRDDSWTFVTVPPDFAEDVAELAAGPRRGFGAVRVEVRIGTSIWRTSIFPDKARGSYVLPVKQAIRRAQSLGPGDVVRVSIELLGI
jgi:hypothetical protein